MYIRLIKYAGDIITTITPFYVVYNAKNKNKFIFIYILTFLLTELFKYMTKVLRPDKSDYKSFPSGHMSSIYISALYFNRYIRKSNILYLLSYITGATRIISKKHTIYDIMGAIILSKLVLYIECLN